METENRTKWVTDPSHSEVTFRVKHLMITNVKGEFRKFYGEAYSSHDYSNSSVHAEIDADSIYTNDEKRDAHLKSADFFDVEHYPKITFDSTAINKIEEDTYELTGNLTIKGITKEVTFKVEFNGINFDPWNNEKAGFSASGKINRKEWGLNWNAALESGGFLVGDEIKIEAEYQMIKQK